MAAAAPSAQPGIVPAQLGFLAIFNPSLGATDETVDDQIVYYASVNAQSQKRRHRSRGKLMSDVSQEERNERLRQIGLAQGMVELSRGFANGEPVSTIETEKTRVVLQEVEPGWWILASIDLTKIPLPPRIGSPTSGSANEPADNVEYSSRELKPSTLLMRDLLRAHSVFLLHHASSLSALFVKSKRASFVKLVGRFWDLFLSTWDVMLHGNPASNVFRGIKIAACGELGVGVGEENRGSGEREVLEGFVGRVEGLTDLVVSKFGSSESALEAEPEKDVKPDAPSGPWLGTGEEPGAEDGAIFLGVGALSRKSLLDITCWMEDLYTWGENAYGVKDSTASTRQGKKKQKSAPNATDGAGGHAQPRDTMSPVSQGSSSHDATPQKSNEPAPAAPVTEGEAVDEGGINRLMSYLKMGYGTHWTLGGSDDGVQTTTSEKQPTKQGAQTESSIRESSDTCGRFLIGLLGDMEEPAGNEGGVADEGEDKKQPGNETGASNYNSRIPLRTLTVELENSEPAEAEQVKDLGSQSTELAPTRSGEMGSKTQFDSQDRNKTQKMRVVVYVNKPFIFTFLFRNRTDSLAWDGLYRSLHHQLAPLRRPLAVSTTYRPDRPDTGEKASNIFDLVWDPKAMTVHSTIPSIPTPAELQRENVVPVWSRAEAVNTHNQILNMYAATLGDYAELERTCKTSRGWWVVWTRLLERNPARISSAEGGNASASDGEQLDDAEQQHDREPQPRVGKEIFLIRRAGDHAGLRGRGASYAETGGWAEGAGRLAQGIGVDTHKYIEGLLSMSR
ncbi:hypothetical protein F4861DRAFT_502206 [Xylaria intraflava]|nr:hypothetical protein F4861DRAFT_502206 [Xylaria intraflava]